MENRDGGSVADRTINAVEEVLASWHAQRGCRGERLFNERVKPSTEVVDDSGSDHCIVAFIFEFDSDLVAVLPLGNQRLRSNTLKLKGDIGVVKSLVGSDKLHDSGLRLDRWVITRGVVGNRREGRYEGRNQLRFSLIDRALEWAKSVLLLNIGSILKHVWVEFDRVGNSFSGRVSEPNLVREARIDDLGGEVNVASGFVLRLLQLHLQSQVPVELAWD